MDPQTLVALIDRHSAALELYARQWCEAPEDVVQEAFVKLVSLDERPRDCAAWLFRAVRNGSLNAATAARRRRRHESTAGSIKRGWFEKNPQTDSTFEIDPETVEQVLKTLPADLRETIVAHIWGGLTFEQIGELTNRSASSAHRSYQSGLKLIRERLGVSCLKNNPDPRTT